MSFTFPFIKKKSGPKPLSAVRKEAGKRTVGKRSTASRRHLRLTVLVGILVWGGATFTSLHRRQLSFNSLVEGQVVQNDLYSSIAFRHIDKDATDRLREEARQKVPPVFVVDQRIVDQSLKFFDLLYARLLLPENPNENDNESDVNKAVSALSKANVLETIPNTLKKLKKQTLKDMITRQLRHGIVTDDPRDTFFTKLNSDDTIVVVDNQGRRMRRTVGEQLTRKEAADAVVSEFSKAADEVSSKGKQALEIFAGQVLRPNLLLDVEMTTRDRNEAAAAVPNQVVVIGEDELLLEQGSRVTPKQIRLVNDYRAELEQVRKGRRFWREAVFHAGLSLCLLLALGYMLKVISPDVLTNSSKLVLIAILVMLQLALTRVFTDFIAARNTFTSIDYMSMVPLTVTAMLMAQLMGLRTTMVAIVYTSLLAAFQSAQPLQLFITSLFSSLVAAMLFSRARKRIHSFQTILGIAFTIMVVQVLFLVFKEVPLNHLDRVTLLALLNGFVVTVAAFVLLPLFEFMFGITTYISLIELSDLNHPLLKRMQLEAPGTYHHSLMVATLAEQAAAAIGANPLLARVIAYFHDIGKMSQPEYFTENMAFGSHTPHDRIRPRMSSMVILNHVREGLALAEKYKLRKVIREGIAQHHGTSLISYFYHRAKGQHEENNDERSLEPRDYRYPGPTPMRKEVVLLSIADTCEAACRSLEKPTPQKIENFVTELINKKVTDGQLDHADLTFKELAIVKQTIISTIVNMSHGRIAYPKDDEKEPNEDTSTPANPEASGEEPAAGQGDDKSGGK